MADGALDLIFLAFQQAVIGRYSLERELGRGGMGVVYLAREVRLDRLVAIKLLPPELAAQAELRDRFLREARTAARLSHPYIVPIHAVDEIDGFVFIVMAYIDGGTLAQRVASHGPLSPAETTRIMREVAWALAYAHAQGVVHRDIKPANILLEGGTGRALVADFGIARLAEPSGDTVVGMVLGTPEFMSPEQATGEALDGRSDLYALGIVAYFALTGTLPFVAPTVQGVLAMQLNHPAPPVARDVPGVPRSLAQAVDRCLEKDPAERFATGEALADALSPALERRPDVPIPVRVFLDRRRAAGLAIAAGLAMPIVSGVVGHFVTHAGRFAPVIHVAAALAIAVAVPLPVVIYRLRGLLRLGYGIDDLLVALRAGFERRREEFQFAFGNDPSLRERASRVVGAVGLIATGAGILALLTGAQASLRFLVPGTVIAADVGFVGTALSIRWRQLREGTGTIWFKLWAGKVGRGLAKVASFRLDRRAVSADRPTELAIAMNAEAMFAAFPKEVRQSLGDVPAVLHGLEAHARVARARIDELDAAIADAQRSVVRGAVPSKQEALVADLTHARHEAEARLAELVTALENLRLDLLRLRAGAGSVEGITMDLAAAREFGAQADRLIAGRTDVERALR